MGYEVKPGQKLPLKKTKSRIPIYNSALDRLLPLIDSPSNSQAIDQAVRLGTNYIDRMRDAKEEYQSIESEIEELRERQRELKQKWETEEIGFEDV